MTVEEIFKQISAHMIKGLMIHDQLADYYDFLSLRGYKRCHEYHYKIENASYRKLHRYYLNHHNRLIPEERIDNPNIIPESWYKYKRQDVDASTKKNAVSTGMNKWVEWETETKDILSKAYTDLMQIEEEASALFIAELIKDVDCELKYAKRKQIDLNVIDYNIEYILQEQTCIHDKYKKLLKG